MLDILICSGVGLGLQLGSKKRQFLEKSMKTVDSLSFFFGLK